MNIFYGIKLGQTQTYTASGVRIPVTEVLVEPLTVIQVKTADRDGYTALKVAFGKRNEKNISKPVLGELKRIKNYELGIKNKKSDDSKTENSETVVGKTENKKQGNAETQKNVEGAEKTEDTISKNLLEIRENPSDERRLLPRYLREIRIKDNQEIKDIKVGDQITIDKIFKEEDMVNVSGVSIGKGFQGGVKRHGFKGGPRTHGQSDRERAPGSIGQTTTPGRVMKGKRMAGRMGGLQATVENLKIVKIDNARNVVLVKGLVPGKKKGVVSIYK